MPYNPSHHRRRSIRLRDYDYASAGAYFVTICTHERVCLFGEVVDADMRLNVYGCIVRAAWDDLPAHYPNVELDAFVVMPNHVHGIIVILGESIVGAQHAAPLRPDRMSYQGPTAGSLGAMIRSFKSAATQRINELRGTPGAPLWQRRYYERVIRNQRELTAIRDYIANNPLCWGMDRENPHHERL